MNPKISVIIPVYNVKQYLQQCLQSLVDQKIFHELEVVAVNDGSTDGSAEILNDFFGKYPNIQVINQENQGIAIARQVSLQNTRGYIAY